MLDLKAEGGHEPRGVDDLQQLQEAEKWILS